MNSIEAFKKYKDLEWTEEQKTLINEAFHCLDTLLFSCSQENNNTKYNELLSAHKIMHDISLTMSLKDMVKDINE